MVSLLGICDMGFVITREGDMKSILIKVSGMHCHSCDVNIQETVSELPGVKKVRADFKKGEVKVDFDETKSLPDDIKKKIIEAGYKPE